MHTMMRLHFTMRWPHAREPQLAISQIVPHKFACYSNSVFIQFHFFREISRSPSVNKTCIIRPCGTPPTHVGIKPNPFLNKLFRAKNTSHIFKQQCFTLIYILKLYVIPPRKIQATEESSKRYSGRLELLSLFGLQYFTMPRKNWKYIVLEG